jgi:hypothetical protein
VLYRAGRPREIFLSHASANRPFAARLAAALDYARLRVWYSSTSIVGARQWHDEIGEALQRCDWFLLVLSPASVRSPWVKRELLFALNDRRFENRIVPVKYRECDWKRLSWTLDAIQIVDFSHGFDAGWDELSRIWPLPRPGAAVRRRRR